ncbi:helix-turn-helix transcriptional regulator [Lacrimispora defluvii]|uniref:Transcriptional regulator n=1 Tax=Lacrimispora defluvii TaxID=2719233 RepID=A0ABX1VUR3_9FIRM|nr:PAS domain-containing protein [Lacrimispora defluvii]NNJ30966.1 transcriptional regulator [Lacrimispora defluvii]
MSDIMKHYEVLTNFLGNVLSDNYEIALLDLREGKRCITAIANGQNSGRTIGAPLTDLALKIIREGIWKKEPYLLNYSGLTKDKRPLISSTFFIKEGQELLGMLCLNVDTQIYQQLCQSILKLGGLSIDPPSSKIIDLPVEHTETFTNDIGDIIASAMPDYITENRIPADRLTQDEKISIVKQLNEKGVFMIKGAVSEAALKLNCSDATIYRYLSKISKQEQKKQIDI